MIIWKRSVAVRTGLLLLALLFFPGPIHCKHHNPVQKLDLERLKLMVGGEGRFLLVFMAAWCAPCIKELPDLNALYIKYRSSGLKIVGVSVDFDGPSAMQPIVDRLKVNFPIFWLGYEVLDAYEISGIPLLMFIRNGLVVEKVVGLHSRAFFDEKIETFLAMP